MRPNNRQRSRGGRSGGGGGGNNHHHKPQHHSSNRTPNRNQIFDSSGPDVRVRGNAHQVFDKYQSLAREAASSGDRILAEAYYQYADHYYRVIQSMGGFVQRTNWGEGGEDGQQPGQQGQHPGQPQQGQGGPQPGDGGGDMQSGDRGEQGLSEQRSSEQRSSEHRSSDNRQGDHRQSGGHRQNDRRQNDYRENNRDRDQDEAEPGLNGVAFLQNGRTAPGGNDPAVEEQPEVPEFVPATGSRRAS
ncbi:DUF4167 domain-containing protein [Reyranella sp.]|uniref:DUF4167 domain-containing protein n=1 Tax=Reyranella sp. TaxID=1929291 RepID=UPI0025F70195|nr:DUF4167 domain-containing protein [Reyranella sp.]